MAVDISKGLIEKPKPNPAETTEKPLQSVKNNTESPDSMKNDEKPSQSQANTDELAKGKPVQLKNGKSGKIIYLHPQMKIARVKLDDGKTVTVSQSALKVLPHVTVSAHIRKVPSK